LKELHIVTKYDKNTLQLDKNALQLDRNTLQKAIDKQA